MINYDYITKYLRSVAPNRNELLLSIESMANKDETYAPIIEPEIVSLLSVILSLHKPRRILELGTAIGYSAIFMAQFLPEDGEIITVERYGKNAALARENIKKSGYNNIKVVEDEAENALLWLDGGFDLIFMDAGKGQYIEFLPSCLKLLKTGGVLVSDDVLYKGMVAEDDLIERRKITIVKRLREYIDIITNHPQLVTTIIPLGDGVAISIKKD